MTHRLRRTAEMLEAALKDNETIPASPEDLKHLSRIKELSQRIRP